MSEDLTHYDVLGVEPSADKDAVRDAYQARLAEVHADVQREQSNKKPDQTSIDGFRREEASIRGAWGVLSDPYQRGRYDATLEMGGAAVDDAASEDAVAEDRTPARATARNRGDRQPYQRAPGMFSPEPLPKPASWPANVQPPPSRARSIAMIIDLVVLFFLFNGLSVAGRAYVDDQYPKETKRLEHIVDCYDEMNAEADRDRTTIARIERVEGNRDCRQSNVSFATGESNVEDRLDKNTDKLTDKYSDVDKNRAGGQIVVQLLLILVLLLYLVPSSVISGRTLGKKLMQIRAVNQDGSRLRLRGAMLRYALPVVAGMMLSTFLGAAMPGLQSFAFIIVLFVVMSWPRNPNLQGMHDRFAKTIVVDG
ncbi:MAG: hypothetical protein FJW86_03815 [Actinobacteria bacterium]|nr:hypothetical protein [Actinomycetota bacterium]